MGEGNLWQPLSPLEKKRERKGGEGRGWGVVHEEKTKSLV